MSGLSRRKVAQTSQATQESRPVGIDPDDHSIVSEESPRLTLMEEIVLLGIKDNQGYLSFWNDSISYVLRGCIMIELALRKRIAVVQDSGKRRHSLQDRIIEVVDSKPTGEPLLDETLKLIKGSEPLSTATWIDYLSGETWNLYKISYQLKQVRERLQKGLVDKGILRTDKMNFLLFDMPTHPVADTQVKNEVKQRAIQLLTLNGGFSSGLRSVALVASAYAANVLENVLDSLSYSARDAAFLRADEMLNDYAEFPFERRSATWAQSLFEEVEKEQKTGDERFNEVVSGVFRVYSQLDAMV